MSSKHISRFPKPLLADLVAGRWLPIVGAGFSCNAVLPASKEMPAWDKLGKDLAAEMADYPYTGALDAISAYSHEYSRTKLVERLSDLLHIDSAQPGKAHKAFCSIQFDIVCTTNFDFLLEKQYALTPRYCRPVIDEDQLSVANQHSSVALLKLHGDLHHPQRMVVTEEDYDLFLDRYPLLATYLANLLITRSGVLIGYSLDDPDFRQIWQVISNRLGTLRRPAYAIVVDARPAEIARYDRRGVKVISLTGSRARYGETLAEAFEELRDYVEANIIPQSKVTKEAPLKELSLPRGAVSRLCFFAVPFALQSIYRERIFPLAARHGLVPVTADEVIGPGENVMGKIDALISRASAVVIDATTSNTLLEAQIAISKLGHERVLLITVDDNELPSDLTLVPCLLRPKGEIPEKAAFLQAADAWFASVAKAIAPQLLDEPQRLLSLREYRAAVISAVTVLESALSQRMQANTQARTRPPSYSELLQWAQQSQLLGARRVRQIQEWIQVRNAAVHTQQAVPPHKAREIVSGVSELITQLQ
jgi:uncharacterized protein YutE (UPF0331/DUF86 family)